MCLYCKGLGGRRRNGITSTLKEGGVDSGKVRWNVLAFRTYVARIGKNNLVPSSKNGLISIDCRKPGHSLNACRCAPIVAAGLLGLKLDDKQITVFYFVYVLT